MTKSRAAVADHAERRGNANIPLFITLRRCKDENSRIERDGAVESCETVRSSLLLKKGAALH